jgi:hypothetical protein
VPHGLPNPDGHSWLAAGEDWYSDGRCADGCHDRAPGTGWLKVTPAAH